jgi:hypothetical protein
MNPATKISTTRCAATLLLWLCAYGCDGRITSSQGGATAGPQRPGPTRPADPNDPIDPTQPVDPLDPGCTSAECREIALFGGPRLARLTHVQWGNTVRDLLALPAVPPQAAQLLADPAGDGSFDNSASALVVDGRLWTQYQEAAEALAAQVARDPAALGRVGPVGDAADPIEARGRAFVEHVGRRAYRRPLAQAEADELVRLFTSGPALLKRAGAGEFEQGAELVLRALLQSPLFLYRAELSAQTSAPGVVPLDGYERASRLSYALWRTMPDEALLTAAQAGELDTREGMERAARRLLDDPQAREVVQDFHSQLLRLYELPALEKDATRYPEFNSALASAMRRELELFIDAQVLGDRAGGVAELYTSRRAHVNQALAKVYGLPGTFGDAFEPVELPADQRAGLLTRAGFLAIKATPYDKNSIHRGVFINHHVICSPLPPVPDNVVLPEVVRGDTNRERITDMTAGCGGACHNAYINPAGFALERYDGLGRYVLDEQGVRIDPAGELLFAGGLRDFTDGVSFSERVATEPDAHACYTRHWFEYLYGRSPGDGDAPLIATLGRRSLEDGLAIREILVALVTSDLFVNRAEQAEEAP